MKKLNLPPAIIALAFLSIASTLMIHSHIRLQTTHSLVTMTIVVLCTLIIAARVVILLLRRKKSKPTN